MDSMEEQMKRYSIVARSCLECSFCKVRGVQCSQRCRVCEVVHCDVCNVGQNRCFCDFFDGLGYDDYWLEYSVLYTRYLVEWK